MKGPSTASARDNRRPHDPKILAEIVRRVVEVAQPDRIILFGSAAALLGLEVIESRKQSGVVSPRMSSAAAA